MVEFISETADTKIEEPPPAEASEIISQRSLELLVEEQAEELQAIETAFEEYNNETASASGDYHAPQEVPLDKAPQLKDELKPWVYDEKERVFVVDIFEKYGKSQPEDDKSWKKQNLY